MTATCERCHRPLKDPESIKLGMGPICRVKRSAKNSNVGVRHANYEILLDESTGFQLVIRDLGPWGQHLTVTNDAEYVVARLTEEGYLIPGRRLFYYDSAGSLDQILLRNGKFSGFAPGSDQ